MIAEGQMAPDVTLPRNGGGNVTLSALRPAPVVIFAYGKDGTPTCTNEVMDFNAHHAAFQALGVQVMGLSKDSVKAHDNFIAKMGITLTLLSDKDGTMMDDWGLFGEKIFMGKKVQGVLRQTILIDGTGKVAKVWQVDKVKGHAEEVLAHLKAGA